MHTKQFHDLEAKILDPEEKAKVLEVVNQELYELEDQLNTLVVQAPTELMEFLGMKTPPEIRALLGSDSSEGGMYGSTALGLAAQFEEGVAEAGLDFNFRYTRLFQSWLDMLAKECTFWEFPFINAKNLLEAMKYREEFVVGKRDNLGIADDIGEIKTTIRDTYGEIQGYLDRALSLFTQYREADDVLAAYSTNIKTYQASLHRRRFLFDIKSIPNEEDVVKPESLSEVARKSRELEDVFIDLFKDAVFTDERTAAVNVANYGNALKLNNNGQRGLKYYEEARKILGDHPDIMAGILFYQSVGGSDLASRVKIVHRG